MNFDTLKLVKVANSLEPPFVHLQQLYEFEFSSITGYDLNEQGLYDQDHLYSLWCKHGFDIYVVYDKTIPVGFTVVNLSSMLNDDPETRDIAEFFVLPNRRKHGVGKWMALKIFALYPGKWEVRQYHSLEVKKFWLEVINEYTKGNYVDIILNDDTWNGSVQKFIST